MDGTFVQEIKNIIDNNQNVGKVVDVNGRTFIFAENRFNEVVPRKNRPDQIVFSDLASFCKIINLNEVKYTMFIQIINQNEVIAYSPLDPDMDRIYPYKAIKDNSRFPFGTWLNYEDFVIGLRANFVQNEDRDTIIKTIASIVNCDSQEISDNGISQTVKTQKGTQLGAKETKSILKLKPYRTFVECEQPESEFLFRIRNNGTQFALFEADGGQWVNEAKHNIKKFIESQIKDNNVIVLI